MLKGNLAFDTELGFWDLTAGAELLLTQVEKGVHFVNVALGDPNGSLPDGRQNFFLNPSSTGFTGTGGLASGNRGSANCIRVNPLAPFSSATKPALNECDRDADLRQGQCEKFTVFWRSLEGGDGTARVAYTHGSAEEVSRGPEASNSPNWNGRLFNPTRKWRAAQYAIAIALGQCQLSMELFNNARHAVDVLRGRWAVDKNNLRQRRQRRRSSTNDLFYIPRRVRRQVHSVSTQAGRILAFPTATITAPTRAGGRK